MSTFKTVEQLQVTIASQAAQIERLREAIEDHIDYADWQYQDQINRGYTNVTKLRAALQPKEEK